MQGLLTHGNFNTRMLFGLGIVITVFMFMLQTAHAAGSAMPRVAPLTRILASIEGPVAKIFGTIVIIMKRSRKSDGSFFATKRAIKFVFLSNP